MSAVNTEGETLAVIVGGTPVPLPNEQVLDGFTANGTSTIFTVPQAGNYLITYRVSTTASPLMSSRVLRNGREIPGLTIAPVSSVSNFFATHIAALAAGDQLQLQLFGLSGTVVLQGGTGASMSVVRLS